MSSGEKAKPPAIEERNPFDISRRSGTDVAAEIAKRMAAWKQARARTSATPTTIPEAKSRIDDVKAAPIAAPVQPARMPKSTPSTPQPAPTATASSTTARGGVSSTLRVPYFASASATRRAMPPAPSLRQGSTHQANPRHDQPSVGAEEPAIPVAVPALDQPPHDVPQLDATNSAPETMKDEAPAAASIDEASIEANAPPAIEPSGPVESPLPVRASDPAPAEPGDTERRRAEARAIKARWMAAHDLDGLLDTSDAEGAPTDAAHKKDGSEGAETSEQLAEDLDSPLPDEKPDDTGGDELLLDEPVELERALGIEEPTVAPDLAAATRDPIAVSADTTERLEPTLGVAREASAHHPAALGRKDPTFDVPVVQQTPDSAREPGIAAQDDAADGQGAEAAASAVTEPADFAGDEGLSITALDEVAGRKEPTFDKPVQHEAKIERPVELQDEAATQSRADEPSATADSAPEDDRAVGALSIAALDEAAGRKEPTFDKPVQHEAPQLERPVLRQTQGDAATRPRAEESAAAVATQDNRAMEDQLSIAALDEAAGRKEPTFDEPVLAAKPAAVLPAAPRIALRPIETRIEVRRIDTLRADPPLSARRPIFPHIEPEEWDMAPMVAAQAHRERRGTGWAISLGTVLLVAGITAPAAIWQQGRQAQDQVALVDAAPAPQQVQTPAPVATATVQATLPAAPQPETPAPAPAVTAQESSAPSAPDQAAPKPEAEQAAANPKPATTLGAVSEGGDVTESPVMMPPPPTVKLASKTEGADVMTARPFVPEQGDGPFLRAPTTGAATVPVAGAPVQSAAVGVKPNLMGQLKPRGATTVSAAKPVVSKTKPARTPKPFFQQSPEQMFNTLIDTLSEGKPVNPATKPASPSNRR